MPTIAWGADMKIYILAVVAAACMTGAAQGQTMTTGWGEIQFDRATCLAGAREAIQAVGYSGITAGTESVFGWSGSNGIAVRCVTERGAVVYFIYGPNQASNERLGDRIRPLLLRGPTGAAPGK